MSNTAAVEEFFRVTEAFEHAMIPTVTYVSWARDGVRFVVKARLRLALQSVDFEPRRFVWNDVAAESFRLTDVGKSPREFIEDILAGRLTSPSGELLFPPRHEGTYAAQFLPLHPEALEQQNRAAVLQVRGDDQRAPLNHAPLDWDLKAASPPYDSLTELCQDFGLGPLVEPACLFEAVASDVVAMDFGCKVVGTNIELAIFAAPGLDTRQVSIGYRLYDKGQVVVRDALSGDQLVWSNVNKAQRGSATVEVPPAAVLHCYARYRGVTHQHRWFNDPTVAQNSRRATYERFDPDLELLRDMCAPKDNKYARDLETAVAWLLWMLGFSVLHLGATKRLQDGPDLIATTPTEHYVVVECTTGQIKGESKLERLVARAAAVRERLEKSNNRHLKVLPVMVTSMTQAEVAAGRQAAREHGVVVLAREDIFTAIDRTLVLPRPDELYIEAERSLAVT
ncbi:MAG: hypothetical protein V4459_15145 [Pseudomonadota bacterium]